MRSAYTASMTLTAKTYELTPTWEYVADTVMGGVSTGGLEIETYKGHTAAVLRGSVLLANNGGFVQIATDLNADGSPFDASAWDGIALTVCGNDTTYDLRLRTDALSRPWQSFRTDFVATTTWQTLYLPFTEMVPHKTDAEFHPAGLRRIGILAIGREMEAEVAVASVAFYRDDVSDAE